MTCPREIRNEARVAEMVKFVARPVTGLEMRRHFIKVWGVSDETVRKVITWAVKSRRIERRYRTYAPVR